MKKPGNLRSVVAFTGGAAFALVLYIFGSLVSPSISALDRGQGPSSGPAWFLLLWRAHAYWVRLFTWPWIAFIFLPFAILAITRRMRDKGWTDEVMAGWSFVVLIYQSILKF
jgi:hypothetical protein